MQRQEPLKIQSILLSIGKLPTLPTVFDQLYKLVNDPKSSMRQVSRVVMSDPAISTRVLRLVNSAYYGLGGKIKSVQHALVVLGFNTIRNLILSISVFRVFGDAVSGPRFDILEFWEHSILCGVAAQFISEKTGLNEPSEVFTAGILHDVGKLILNRHLGEEYDSAFLLADENGIEFFEAERQLWGITHEEVGGDLQKAWNLPASLIHAVSHHHNPDGATADKSLLFQVHLANAFAHVFADDSNRMDFEEVSLKPETWDILGLTNDKLLGWGDRILERFETAKEFLTIAEEEAG